MNSLDKLTEIFSHFPGIGPRQAKRFVYYLLSRNQNFSQELIRAVEEMRREVAQCKECMRYFPHHENGASDLCSICSDPTRDESMLMIVPRDIDLEAVEKSGAYKGYYFVLGGSLPILEKEPSKRIRVSELKRIIEKKKSSLQEVILAMNANAEGENTADFIKDLFRADNLIFSSLGRGLSTGAELEYADPDTLSNAFLHRTK
jgi:recombination protein RecR